MSEEKPQVSPIQREDLEAKKLWDGKHVLDLEKEELAKLCKLMQADGIAVIGIQHRSKEIIVSVLNLHPDELKHLFSILNGASSEVDLVVERNKAKDTHTVRRKTTFLQKLLNIFTKQK